MVSSEAYKSIKCTTEAIMYIRSFTWVYFISYQVYFRSLTSVYCICHQLYCRGHHLTSGTTQGCASEASLWCTAFAIKCTVEPSSNIGNNTEVYFRSLTWVCCIYHEVYCRGHHLASGKTLGCILGASLRCATFAIKWSAYPIM